MRESDDGMTTGHGSRRGTHEDRAIVALLSEPSIPAAAVQAGISESTLKRWMQDPDFRTKYRAARQMVVEHAVGRLQQAAAKAADTLVRNLDCGMPAVEVGAAKAVFDLTAKASESDTAERLEAIEQVLSVEHQRGAA
jgi:hypothetical protein